MNSSRRLDTAAVTEHHESTVTPALAAAGDVTYHRYDPTLPPLDYNKMLDTLPDHVVFNGRPDPCSFHVVGEQFDTVYLGAPPQNAIRGVQTFGVAPGGGMVFEMVADVPGEFPFVNHGFGHGQKGTIGSLVVEGQEGLKPPPPTPRRAY